MIITIDGPVASGKSSVARALAQYYNYYYLNTGLLYRAIAYLFLSDKKFNIKNIEKNIESILQADTEELIKNKKLSYTYDSLNNEQIFINTEENITFFLKDSAIDNIASIISENINIRLAILDYQRELGQKYDLIADGRDCGSVLFPYADYKFFLTASLEKRAHRWQQDQLKYKNIYTLKESIEFITERDKRDIKREYSPLIIPENAYVIDTSFYNKDEVIREIKKIIKKITMQKN